jgi:hypothetical protein
LLQRKHDLRFRKLRFLHGNRQAPILS